MRICFIGDSFVNGTGDDDALGWPGRVVSMARSKGLDVTYYNLGSAATRATTYAVAGARKPNGVFRRTIATDWLFPSARTTARLMPTERRDWLTRKVWRTRSAYCDRRRQRRRPSCSVPRQFSMMKRSTNALSDCPAIFKLSVAIMAFRFSKFSPSSLSARPGGAKPVERTAPTPTEKVIRR